MKKVTVVGAGSVGATCADVLAQKNFLDEVVLIDIKEGVAEGKALDIWESSAIKYFDTRVVGYTNDYSKTEGSIIIRLRRKLEPEFRITKNDSIFVCEKPLKNKSNHVEEKTGLLPLLQ